MLEENQCTVEVGRQNAQGKDIFRKVKDLQVGRLQRKAKREKMKVDEERGGTILDHIQSPKSAQ